MARTTSDAVKGIIETDDTSIPDLTPFIDAANELVTEVCAVFAGYSSTRLELIERWLAAHFYAIRDMRVSSESAGVSASYQYRVDLGLANTMYGQQAIMLDTNGGLAKLNQQMTKGKRAVGVAWLGTDRDGEDE